jgi:hypothetical protein
MISRAATHTTGSSRQQAVLSRAANRIVAQLGEINAATKEPDWNTWFFGRKRLERCPSKSGAFRSEWQLDCLRRILSDPAMITTHPPTSEVAQPAVHQFSPASENTVVYEWGNRQ